MIELGSLVKSSRKLEPAVHLFLSTLRKLTTYKVVFKIKIILFLYFATWSFSHLFN